MESEREVPLDPPARHDWYDYVSELRYIDDGNPNCFDPEPFGEPGPATEAIQVTIPLTPQDEASAATLPPVPRR